MGPAIRVPTYAITYNLMMKYLQAYLATDQASSFNGFISNRYNALFSILCLYFNVF